MLDTLSDVLAATGYETSMASSERAAMEKAQAGRFDLIVMVARMLGLNSVQTSTLCAHSTLACPSS
jgi:DNA-binding response OmpR family regulator